MKIRAVAAIGLLVGAITVGVAAPAQADSGKPDFARQARDAGLTTAEAASLQQRVNAYLARTGGTQVSINKIDLDGKGELLLTLPGQKFAGDIGAHPNAGPVCSYGRFCAYSGTNLSGDLLTYFYCAYKLSMPFIGQGSYSNAQTDGTVGHFYDDNGTFMYDTLPAPMYTLTFNWNYVYWIKPCGGD